jgi:hypothetical protein
MFKINFLPFLSALSFSYLCMSSIIDNDDDLINNSSFSHIEIDNDVVNLSADANAGNDFVNNNNEDGIASVYDAVSYAVAALTGLPSYAYSCLPSFPGEINYGASSRPSSLCRLRGNGLDELNNFENDSVIILTKDDLQLLRAHTAMTKKAASSSSSRDGAGGGLPSAAVDDHDKVFSDFVSQAFF